jgi:hypothetical protein
VSCGFGRTREYGPIISIDPLTPLPVLECKRDEPMLPAMQRQRELCSPDVLPVFAVTIDALGQWCACGCAAWVAIIGDTGTVK